VGKEPAVLKWVAVSFHEDLKKKKRSTAEVKREFPGEAFKK